MNTPVNKSNEVKTMYNLISHREYIARQSNNCICLRAKEQGSVVCWDCFKRLGDLSFKWFQGTYDEWLIKINHTETE